MDTQEVRQTRYGVLVGDSQNAHTVIEAMRTRIDELEAALAWYVRELQAERELARFCFGCGKEFDEMAAK